MHTSRRALHYLVWRRSGAAIPTQARGYIVEASCGPVSREQAGNCCRDQWARPVPSCHWGIGRGRTSVRRGAWTSHGRSGTCEIVAIAKLNLAMVAICKGALADHARPMLLDAIAIATGHGFEAHGPECRRGDGRNGGLSEQELGRPAARLFGAAEAQAAQTGLHRDPPTRPSLAPLVARARDALGADSFGIAEAAGRCPGLRGPPCGRRKFLDCRVETSLPRMITCDLHRHHCWCTEGSSVVNGSDVVSH